MMRAHKCMTMINPEEALPGRDEPVPTSSRHLVNGESLMPPYPAHCRQFLFGMGCFWGAERLFWSQPGVHVTAVGYAGGYTPNPLYQEVCTGMTGHAEVVRVVYDPDRIQLAELLRLFWESHDPTQGMQQGNDLGSQYRSVLYADDEEQLAVAEASRKDFQGVLNTVGLGRITTETAIQVPFYFAEDYHQQYLARNPAGYCGLQGLGVPCPVAASRDTISP